MAYNGPDPYPIIAGGTGATTATQARINLGLQIGVNVQAFDATLQSLSALGTTADRIAYTTGVDTWAETTLTSYGRTLIDDVDAATARTTLGVVIGTNVQAFDATLQSISALGTTADRMIYTTGVDTWAESTLTAFARTLNAAATQAAAQTILGISAGNGGCLVTTFLASGTFTKNAASKFIEIYTWGGGGGGGSGSGNNSAAGGGGGGGAGGFVYSKCISSVLTSPVTVTIGAGGTGGAGGILGSSGNNGTPGGNTTFGSNLTANGGGAGLGAIGTAFGVAGLGQPTLNMYNITGLSNLTGTGGVGASSTVASVPAASNNILLPTGGGGGGGRNGVGVTGTIGSVGGSITNISTGSVLIAGGTAGAGATGAGTNGGNGSSNFNLPFIAGGTGGGGGGGSAGAAGATSGAGGNGIQPGGGGGGSGCGTASTPTAAGGNGGAGQVIVIEWF